MGYAQKMPLFPLNTVLFPGMVLPLHIFEERYKRMIQDCLATAQDFGVVLIREGFEVGGPAVPFDVGTTARLTEVQRLNGGRMNISAVGRRRFRILQLHYDRPYLTGDVEFIPLRGGHSSEAMALADRVRPRVARYIELLVQAVGVNISPQELPSDPTWLAYMTAIALQIPNREKQELLAASDVIQLLSAEVKLLQREEALLRFMIRTQKDQDRLVTGIMSYLYAN
ncbi:MAG: LON peptidase substrate-binding domain-containing protein [Anaerolineae bacterium]|nr:LON peptidase substrate-binding domain-containing protein [Anaerolineae bacterium]MDW8098130.1 LON peptidase substrate-binding domain-containing protein [Anaerolineae bacterium]